MTRHKAATKRRALPYQSKPVVSESSHANNCTEKKASSDTDSGQWKKLLVCAVSSSLISAAEGDTKVRLVSLDPIKNSCKVMENRSLQKINQRLPDQCSGEFLSSSMSQAESFVTEKVGAKTQSEQENNTLTFVLSSADTWSKSNDTKTEALKKQERLSQLFDCNHPPDRSVSLSPLLTGVTSGHPNLSANKTTEEGNHGDVDITLRYYRVMRDGPKLPLMDTKLRTCDGFYKCRICRRVFLNRFSLTGHYRSHYDTKYVVRPHYCQECGQEHTSTTGLRSHCLQNCYALRTRNQDHGALSSVNPHSTGSSRPRPMRISDAESKRKCIKIKQRETVRKTQIVTLRSKFAGNSVIEGPTRKKADASNSTKRARSSVKQMDKHAHDGLSEGSQIRRSVEMSVRMNHMAFSFPGGGGFEAHSHSRNYPGNREISTAAQTKSGECIKIPQSSKGNDKESQTSGWPELITEETALTETPESSHSTAKIQLKQILEQTCRSRGRLQRMSLTTSGALSQRNSRNAQPLWTILHSARSAFTPVNRNHALSNSPNYFVPSVSEHFQANLVKRGVHGSIRSTSGLLCQNGCTFYPVVYPYLCRLTGVRALDKQISLTPSGQFVSSQLRQPSGAGERCLSEDCR